MFQMGFHKLINIWHSYGWTWITCYIRNNRENVRIWFKLITLSFHMSHALQPLNVFCFKPFKTTLRKERDAIIMAKGKYNKFNKFTFIKWVHKTLNQSLTKHNIKTRSKATSIWPLNLRAMSNKTLFKLLHNNNTCKRWKGGKWISL